MGQCQCVRTVIGLVDIIRQAMKNKSSRCSVMTLLRVYPLMQLAERNRLQNQPAVYFFCCVQPTRSLSIHFLLEQLYRSQTRPGSTTKGFLQRSMIHTAVKVTGHFLYVESGWRKVLSDCGYPLYFGLTIPALTSDTEVIVISYRTRRRYLSTTVAAAPPFSQNDHPQGHCGRAN